MDSVPPLSPHRAQLWFFDLDAPPAEVEHRLGLLDAEEAARAARFRFARDRTAFIVSHAVLRSLLGAQLGRAPDTVRLAHAPGEKPRLADGGALRFNLSHSGTIGMIGLATSEIGVDVETLRPLAERDAIAAGNFAPAEVRALLALPEPARHRAFFACWTRKEAYLKALGTGLSEELARFEVTIDGPARLCAVDGRPGEPARWSMWSGAIGSEALAAAAAPDPAMKYDRLDWRPPAGG